MIKVLFIEDDKVVRENTAELLQLANYEVITACDGVEGLRKAEEEIPDLILLDVMMPQMDGYTVASKLGQSKETKSIPIIMFTARSSTDDVSRSSQLGAVDYIVKPFDQLVLLEKVKKHLSEKKRR